MYWYMVSLCGDQACVNFGPKGSMALLLKRKTGFWTITIVRNKIFYSNLGILQLYVETSFWIAFGFPRVKVTKNRKMVYD
jgi:hypothetical protein